MESTLFRDNSVCPGVLSVGGFALGFFGPGARDDVVLIVSHCGIAGSAVCDIARGCWGVRDWTLEVTENVAR